MKVLVINGSPRRNGNTAIALGEMEKVFSDEGIEVERIQVGARDIRGCIGCHHCMKERGCVFDDLVNEAAQDVEGLQQMRTLARNMAFLMKSIALGREQFGIPEKEPFARMNFIR